MATRLPLPLLCQVAPGCIERLLILLGLEAGPPRGPGPLVRCCIWVGLHSVGKACLKGIWYRSYRNKLC
jgi:hypothetical protein